MAGGGGLREELSTFYEFAPNTGVDDGGLAAFHEVDADPFVVTGVRDGVGPPIGEGEGADAFDEQQVPDPLAQLASFGLITDKVGGGQHML